MIARFFIALIALTLIASTTALADGYSAPGGLSSTGNGSSVTSTATGAPAARTLAARAADAFNVRDYGALGTGSSATIGTTYGSSLSAVAAYTAPNGSTPFSWMTSATYGLTFTLNTSTAQGMAGTGHLATTTAYVYWLGVP